MNEIRQTNIPLAKVKGYGGLEEEYIGIVNEIFVKNNPNCLKGEKARKFFERMQKLSKLSYKEHADELIHIYKKVLEQLKKDVAKFKGCLGEVLSSGKEVR